MNAPFLQTERLGRLTTNLGHDVQVLLRFDGSDHLNDLFDYRVEALATRDDLDFDALVGTHATVEIEAHETMRPFDGIVTSARWAGVGETYLCLTASHHFVSEAYGSGGQGSDGYAFTGSYVLMPDTAPMAPPKRTPLAVVQGPQTAEVVGEGEIDCDEYGRILVRFHWDLANAYSMRSRVSQNWAGAGWGGMVIPRIGMEVVVEFLEGDPDKPLVTGNVFNGKNDAPYPLPQHKTRSTFRTDTHRGEGFNELRFEDERGEEEIFIPAQKDRNEKIENNQTQRVDVNKVESIGHDKSSEIGNNLMQVVDGNMELRVGPANAGTVTPAGAERLVEGIGPRANQIGRPGEGPQGQGNLTVSVERSKVQTIGESHSERVGDRKSINVGASHDLFAKQQIHIEADEEIRLTCGPTQITMTGDGNIRVNGRKIFNVASDLIEFLADKVKVN